MATCSLDQEIDTYLDALSHHRRCLASAQSDAYQSLLAAWMPAYPLEPRQMEQRFDHALLASVALLQVHADGQRQFQRLAERWMGDQRGIWLATLHEQDSPFRRVLLMGDASCHHLSRLSGQVGHFAVTRWGSVAVSATHDARRAWKQAHQEPVVH